jgi:hypothetical protein
MQDWKSALQLVVHIFSSTFFVMLQVTLTLKFVYATYGYLVAGAIYLKMC